ncbi:MAG: acylneuraminate cytidylyltransferase [Chloroflexi bacterium]|nr:acylneuraminate cytidylyltransferase [Chloroflexota bacterium]
MTDVLIIIQARTGSTRFPEKVLQPLLGIPLLHRMIERVKLSKYGNHVVVATTWLPNDDIIAHQMISLGQQYYRGHPYDLLDRHYNIAREYNAQHIVKIPSDCPLIDPEVINYVIDYYLNNQPNLDYAGNVFQPSWPDGNDVEIFSFTALEQAYFNAKEKYQREHTTPYIYKNDQLFKIANVNNPSGGYELYQHYRLTLDYPEDFEVIRMTFNNLFPKNPQFGWNEIVEFLKENPEINAINAKYHSKSWMNDHYSKTPIEKYTR